MATAAPDQAIRPDPPRVGIVPAAGLGTRLRPLTEGALPKEMLPVGRRLALEHIVAELRAAGISEIVFVLSPAKEEIIKRHFGEGDASGLTFRYARQPEMRGLGEAVLRAAPLVRGDSFVIALGDAVFEESAPGCLTRRLMDGFRSGGAAVGLAVQRVPRERLARYGVVKPAAGADASAPFFRITDIVEKPAPEEAPSDLAAAARYVVSRDVFARLEATPPGRGGEVQLTDALRAMLGGGAPSVAVPLRSGEVRHDIGGLDSYFRAFTAFALRDPEHGDGLRTWLRAHLDAAGTQEENIVE